MAEQVAEKILFAASAAEVCLPKQRAVYTICENALAFIFNILPVCLPLTGEGLVLRGPQPQARGREPRATDPGSDNGARYE
jgi:hypothetical protein